MRTLKNQVLWATVVLCGCLDLTLIDEMLLIDAGATPVGDSTHSTNPNSSDGTGAAATLPVPDPDDTTAPELITPDCGSSEQSENRICIASGPTTVSLRFVTDEPAEVSLTLDGNGRAGVLSPQWTTVHHAVITELEKDVLTPVHVRTKDINDNYSEIEVVANCLDGPTVAITEILADPFGSEPGQEFVEIANYGFKEVDLSGWMIDDNSDANSLDNLIADNTILGPGEVAIVVSAAYDTQSGLDPAPDPTAMVIVLDSTVCTNGLRNSDAESVELYDAAGMLISQYRGQAGTPKEGVSAVRLTAELPDGDKQAFALEPNAGSTPGQTPFL